MCGIVGYLGGKLCRQFIFEGLSRLEYRGYDSSGIVCVDVKNGQLNYAKTAGDLNALKKILETNKFDGYLGMGHTRWATHGQVADENAHPHFNCEKTIAVVHNGIIEGHEEIRARLEADGHIFLASSDTEVIAHLMSHLLKVHHGNLQAAVLALVQQIKGAYALTIISKKHPDVLVAVKRHSPLVIGVGNYEMFVASDCLVFADHTKDVLFMPENSFALIKREGVELYSFEGHRLSVPLQHVTYDHEKADKQGFAHYMLKEMYEQKRAVFKTIAFCKALDDHRTHPGLGHREETLKENGIEVWRQLGVAKEDIINLEEIHLIGAGTSCHAAQLAKFFFETVAGLPTHVHLASEFLTMPFLGKKNSLYIAISQSGETMDTLQALRLVNTHELSTVALANVASSTIVREAGGFLPMQAGPEISVVSTKAFSVQLSLLYWLAHRMALERGVITQRAMQEAEEDLYVAAEILEVAIEMHRLAITQHLAARYAAYQQFIFLGRHISYPFAMEAALKLKEISYLFVQCYPAGELKHGPIALIDEKTPIVLFSSLDEVVYTKLVSNAQEVKARKGRLLIFAFEEQHQLINLADDVFIIPRVKPLLAPLAMTGVMQFFVYQLAMMLDRPIDRPRNLAKSVTVE